MNCKTCNKNIDNLYYITKKPYCSKKCEEIRKPRTSDKLLKDMPECMRDLRDLFGNL